LHGRILLAEDGLDNQRLISLVLRRAGAEVEVADNGRIALQMLTEALDHSPYDLLITDIQMPEMDGYTLTARAREIGVSVPIIALTAHVMAEDRQRCLEAGCNDFAAKPLDKMALVTTCAKWLKISRDLSRLPFSI
jgi:CheY-like chemotaxis protein